MYHFWQFLLYYCCAQNTLIVSPGSNFRFAFNYNCLFTLFSQQVTSLLLFSLLRWLFSAPAAHSALFLFRHFSLWVHRRTKVVERQHRPATIAQGSPKNNRNGTGCHRKKLLNQTIGHFGWSSHQICLPTTLCKVFSPYWMCAASPTGWSRERGSNAKLVKTLLECIGHQTPRFQS